MRIAERDRPHVPGLLPCVLSVRKPKNKQLFRQLIAGRAERSSKCADLPPVSPVRVSSSTRGCQRESSYPAPPPRPTSAPSSLPPSRSPVPTSQPRRRRERNEDRILIESLRPEARKTHLLFMGSSRPKRLALPILLCYVKMKTFTTIFHPPFFCSLREKPVPRMQGWRA